MVKQIDKPNKIISIKDKKNCAEYLRYFLFNIPINNVKMAIRRLKAGSSKIVINSILVLFIIKPIITNTENIIKLYNIIGYSMLMLALSLRYLYF